MYSNHNMYQERQMNENTIKVLPKKSPSRIVNNEN